MTMQNKISRELLEVKETEAVSNFCEDAYYEFFDEDAPDGFSVGKEEFDKWMKDYMFQLKFKYCNSMPIRVRQRLKHMNLVSIRDILIFGGQLADEIPAFTPDFLKGGK